MSQQAAGYITQLGINLPHKACSPIDFDRWQKASVPSAEVRGYEVLPFGRMEYTPKDCKS